METPDNRIEVTEEIVPGVTLRELRQIHKQFNAGRCSGEFTIAEYAKSVGINYYKASLELQDATDAGRLIKRMVGRKTYYGFANDSPST